MSINFNRPLNNLEKKMGSHSNLECNTKKGEVIVSQEIHEKQTTKTFTFDKVFGCNSSQIDVYHNVVEPIVDEVLMGYNCTVFALVNPFG